MFNLVESDMGQLKDCKYKLIITLPLKEKASDAKLIIIPEPLVDASLVDASTNSVDSSDSSTPKQRQLTGSPLRHISLFQGNEKNKLSEGVEQNGSLIDCCHAKEKLKTLN